MFVGGEDREGVYLRKSDTEAQLREVGWASSCDPFGLRANVGQSFTVCSVDTTNLSLKITYSLLLKM